MKSAQVTQALSALTVMAAALMASAPVAAQTNLINNGSFEPGAAFLEGWAVQYSQGTFVQIGTAFGTCVGGAPNTCLYAKDGAMTISQSFTAAAGTALNIGAAYVIENNVANTSFEMLFNGMTLFSSSTATPAGMTAILRNASATGGSDTLTIQFNGLDGQAFLLDEVSVTAVPEPTAMALFAMGLAGLGVVRRVRKAA